MIVAVRNVLFFSSLVFILFQSIDTFALSCLRNSLIHNANNIEKIAIFGKDNRMTIPEYAKKHGISAREAELKFSATGKIICPGGTGTAQLTGRNDLITTCAHAFFDDHCNPLPIDCIFETQFGRTRKIKIKSSTARIGKCDRLDPKDDWAVMELEQPVDDARPYLVPDYPVELSPFQTLIQPSAIAANFVRQGQMPKHVIECQVRDLDRFQNTPVQTDCDGGHGTSGSAQLIESENGLVLESLYTKQTHVPDGTEYDGGSRFNMGTTVSGDFYDALTEMMNKK